jgi:hypothetical protein
VSSNVRQDFAPEAGQTLLSAKLGPIDPHERSWSQSRHPHRIGCRYSLAAATAAAAALGQHNLCLSAPLNDPTVEQLGLFTDQADPYTQRINQHLDGQTRLEGSSPLRNVALLCGEDILTDQRELNGQLIGGRLGERTKHRMGLGEAVYSVWLHSNASA